MSYEAWRREVGLGLAPDWDTDRNDYAVPTAQQRAYAGAVLRRMMERKEPVMDMNRCAYCGDDCDGDVCDQYCAAALDRQEEARLDALTDADHPELHETDGDDTDGEDLY